MANVYGQKVDRQQLLRKINHMSQLAYVRPFLFSGGKEEGMKGFEVSNGTGLEFTLLESKCLDIINMKYKGMNLNFIPKSGLVAPSLVDMNGTEFLRNISGGMMYTCGLLNVGDACVDEGLNQVFHGRMKTAQAEKVSVAANWDGDDYVMSVSGEMREAALFHDNLVLKRTIRTKMGAKSVRIHDEIENQGYAEQGLMLLYHVVAGYPIVDEGARFVLAGKAVNPREDGTSEKNVLTCRNVTSPVDNADEQVFIHSVYGDQEGKTGVALINDRLGMGVYVKYNSKMLPKMVEWKSMISGDYAFGMEPSTCLGCGRLVEKKKGQLLKIAPFETKVFDVEIGVLEGSDEIQDFENYVGKLK